MVAKTRTIDMARSPDPKPARMQVTRLRGGNDYVAELGPLLVRNWARKDRASGRPRVIFLAHRIGHTAEVTRIAWAQTYPPRPITMINMRYDCARHRSRLHGPARAKIREKTCGTLVLHRLPARCAMPLTDV
jgi:hypothetical protein